MNIEDIFWQYLLKVKHSNALWPQFLIFQKSGWIFCGGLSDSLQSRKSDANWTKNARGDKFAVSYSFHKSRNCTHFCSVGPIFWWNRNFHTPEGEFLTFPKLWYLSPLSVLEKGPTALLSFWYREKKLFYLFRSITLILNGALQQVYLCELVLLILERGRMPLKIGSLPLPLSCHHATFPA